MAKPIKRKKARELRRNGESIKKISQQLKVSPSSVSRWCTDVLLTDEQIKELERRSKDPNYGRRLQYSLAQQKKRIEKTKRLKKQGIEEIGSFTTRDLFITGVALYWAEGFKKDSQVGFASSDARMIKLFVKWLKECFGYVTDDFLVRVTANISHQKRIEDIELYWSKILEIDVVAFRKPFFQKVKWKKIYDNPNEYNGVLRIKVRKSKDFLRKIHGYIDGLALQAETKSEI